MHNTRRVSKRTLKDARTVRGKEVSLTRIRAPAPSASISGTIVTTLTKEQRARVAVILGILVGPRSEEFKDVGDHLLGNNLYSQSLT
jgi:hypothetical protein